MSSGVASSIDLRKNPLCYYQNEPKMDQRQDLTPEVKGAALFAGSASFMDSSHAEEEAKNIYPLYQQVVQGHDQAE